MGQEPDVQRNNRRGVVAIVAVALVLLAGVVWLTIWALGRSPSSTVMETGDRRSAWESAMRKASVEATYPGGPVDLEEVRVQGAQSFSAEFTPEELEALLEVYRYSGRRTDREISLSSVRIRSAEGRVTMRGKLTVGDSAYSARITGKAEWSQGRVDIADDAEVSVEGFTLGGTRKAQAIAAVEDYLTALVKAAPGLVVEEATVTERGVAVTGTAPARLTHPTPADE